MTEQKAPRSRKLGIVAILAAVVLLGGVLVKLLPRWRVHAEVVANANVPQPDVPVVNVVIPKRSAPSSDLLLPGSVQAVQEASIYARTNGYVRKRLGDIGDKVTGGQLLAEIESPEVDQELLQARATLLQARASLGQTQANFKQVQANLKQVQANLTQVRANTELARTTAARWRQLEQDEVVSHQQAEEKQAAFEAAQASVSASQANVEAVQANVEAVRANLEAVQATIRAQEANVKRLETVQSFQKVTAPFAGVITARNIEVGALITAGSSTTSRELFKVAQIDTLRVYVNVPQTFVASIQPGQAAQLLVRELPQKAFAGKVVRTTSALDATSRTLPMEVQVSNQEHVLLPGMYAQVKFSVARAMPPILVPATALILRNDGPQVAIVQADQTVRYQKVKVERDYGTEIEIATGLNGDETLVVNPSSSLLEGKLVRIVTGQQK